MEDATGTRSAWWPIVAVVLALQSCAPDPCFEHWRAWHEGRGPYSAVCPVDRAMDSEKHGRR